MTANIDLTNQQILYLLKIFDLEKEATITILSKEFQCSKANSKYILDRMVKMGLLYKDKNVYKFSLLGERMIHTISKERDKVNRSLQNLEEIKDEDRLEIANSLMFTENGLFREKFLHKMQYSCHDFSIGSKISFAKILSYLGKGEKRIPYSIFKCQMNSEKSHIEESMAREAFKEIATLSCGEKSFIQLHTKPLSKMADSYQKQGVAVAVSYLKSGNEVRVKVVDGLVKLPFEIIDTWSLLSQNLLQGLVWLHLYSRVGLYTHVEKALFVFTIDLLNLEKVNG